ncbi:LOW QUALITY PROTEIN: hypothetical protein JCM19055_3878 [Geomicrobium sp. JCM 19055]|nr:LOW QUALITY PROTEIN: hypothetical protein JCM19055_3878 [Geomicrobium sp. JCM 19055]
MYRKRFERFAIDECEQSSELYKHLALAVAKDDSLLTLSAEARKGQPVANLFFCVCALLDIKGNTPCGLLCECYRTKAYAHTFTEFKSFCETHESELTTLLHEKLVQTNEVRRCAYLYPLFSYIYEKVQEPLSCIEIGTSAGLQLFWDQYRYSYETDLVYGNPFADVHITSSVKGGDINPTYLPSTPPPVAARIGVDLHINDVSKEEDRLWLDALIGEHQERRELFEQAARVVQSQKAQLIEADGVSYLSSLVEKCPSHSTVCVFHTHVANQFNESLKQQLEETVNDLGATRNLFHVYNNMRDSKLRIDSYIDGTKETHVIGETDGHGRWFEWLLN